MAGDRDRRAGRSRARPGRAAAVRLGPRAEAARHVLEEDARDSQAFVDRWRPRVDAMANARHAKAAGADSGRNARAEALLRAGAGRAHRSARPPRRPARPVSRRGAVLAVDRVTARGRSRIESGRPRRPPQSRRFTPSAICSAVFACHGFTTPFPSAPRDRSRCSLNAAAVGETAMPARELLDALLAIEQERGRARPYPNAPRSLDLDLISVWRCHRRRARPHRPAPAVS